MVDPKIVSEWISKANEDFEFASVNLKENKPFFSQICFHFQQAAEKYLKAFIIANDLEFLRSHDLPLLLKMSLSKDISLERLHEDCEYLNAFYVETRYPVHWPTRFSADDAQRAFQSASRIRSNIKEKLTKYLNG